MLKEIWITRHGYREDWETDTPPLPTGLKHDPPLSDFGRTQAEELCNYLKDKGIERVYSSPLYRVLETVTPLVKATGIPLFVDNSMGEWYGRKYLKYLQPASMEQLQAFFPIDTSHKSSIPLPIEREGVDDCHDRVKKGLDVLVEQLDKEDKVSKVLLAGHAASVICAVRALIQDRTFMANSGTCSLSKLERNSDGTWNLVANGNCDHLGMGQVRSWMFAGEIPDYVSNIPAT